MNPKKNLSNYRQFAIVMVCTTYLFGLLYYARICVNHHFMETYERNRVDVLECTTF